MPSATTPPPWTPEPTCREFLGMARGYCPRPAVAVAGDRRAFCQEHADERNEFDRLTTERGRD